MNSYQLGKVGITLLGLYLLVAALLAAADVINGRLVDLVWEDAALLDLGLRMAGALLIVAFFGVIPAAFLIRRRRVLARRWCASSDDGEGLEFAAVDVLRVGLSLIGVVTLVGGLLAVPGALGSLLAVLLNREGEIRVDLLVGGLSGIGRGLLGLLIGAWLLRASASLAERWEEGT